MFESCHSAGEVAHVYRRMGFPVSCAFDRVALVATPTLGAVTMPATLGSLVRQALTEDHRCESVPILTYSRSHREWVFLVGPAWGGQIARRTLESLEARGVRVLDAGQRIWLPMTDHPTSWYWVSQPVNARTIPSRTSVLADAREFVGRIALSTAWM
ncbi:hypothetical protein OG225_36855 [Nocardia sp. NBC_01377]|uniref:hypothetical protein n=1 Tax=Nocardia sp. NBC_01377 TaxID=2903595 RepID=UPI00324DF159